MDIKMLVKQYVEEGYDMLSAQSKVAQDILLNKIFKSRFKNHVTIKGGVVMHNISNSYRRATHDIDLDFIKYSLEEKSIQSFIDKLNSVNDGINVEIVGKIEELHHQDYNGKRVYVRLINGKNVIDTKLDIGVHKSFELSQEEYYFNLNSMGKGVNLLINSCEQIFTEKLKSLLIFGIRTTRYKDLFDLYFLINTNKLDNKKLIETFGILIFKDSKMREKSVEDIYERLRGIFRNPIYKLNLSTKKDNWLDEEIDKVLKIILKFINNLVKENVNQ